MIVCSRCGFENEDSDAFCGSCAGFLEWEGKKADSPTDGGALAGLAPAPIPGEHEAPDGLSATSQSPLADPPSRSAEPASPPPPPQPGPAGPQATPLVAADPVGSLPVASSSERAEGQPPPTAAEELPAGSSEEVPQPASPVPAAAPGPQVPTAVLPGAPQAPRVRKPERPPIEVSPGDKVCPACGQGNDSARNFCRRCGASLKEAQIFTLPWYRRLLGRLRHRRSYVAGSRPGQRRRLVGGHGGGLLASIVRTVVLLAVVALVVLSLVGPYSHTLKHRYSVWYHDIVGKVHPTYVPVHPVGAVASSSVDGFPASNLIDGASNTSWRSEPPGVGQQVTLSLATPVQIAELGILSGDQDQGSSSYVTTARPERLSVSYLYQGRVVATQIIALSDSASFQTFKAHDPAPANQVRLVVESLYPPVASGWPGVSMTQVELFSEK